MLKQLQVKIVTDSPNGVIKVQILFGGRLLELNGDSLKIRL